MYQGSSVKKAANLAIAGAAISGLLLVAGCATDGGSNGGGSGESGQTHVFEFSMHTGENDTVSLVNQRFIDEVAERSDGRITINPHFAGSLFGPDQSFDAISAGTVDIALQTSSFASGAVPDLAVLEVPYGTPADSASVSEFHATANPIVEEIYLEHDQKLLFSNPAILPATILCNAPVDADADLSGRLIRTAGPWQGAVIESWGGTPVTMGVAELYTALQTGTVDCALQVYNLVDSLKLAEVAPHISRLDFGANYNTVNMNLQAWERLSEEDQQILLDAGAAAQSYGIELLETAGEAVMESIVASGGEFCRPSDAVIQQKVDDALTVRDAIAAAATTEAGAELIAVSDSFQDRMVVQLPYGPSESCK